MIRGYIFKIQWILKPKDAYKLIRLLGVRGFDKVLLRESYDYKIVDTYTGFINYPSGVAEEETIKYLKRQIRKSKTDLLVEVLRK